MNTKILSELVTASPKSQKEIASELGMSQQRFNNYVNGQREPDLDTASLIASYFHVSLDYLAGKKEADPIEEAGLDSQERELIRIARGLSPERQEILLRIASVVAGKDSLHIARVSPDVPAS